VPCVPWRDGNVRDVFEGEVWFPGVCGDIKGLLTHGPIGCLHVLWPVLCSRSPLQPDYEGVMIFQSGVYSQWRELGTGQTTNNAVLPYRQWTRAV